MLCWSALPNYDEIAKAVHFQRKDFGSRFRRFVSKVYWPHWNSAEGACHSKSAQEANYRVSQEVGVTERLGSSSLSRAKHQKASYTPASQRLPQLLIILSWGENFHVDLWGTQIIHIRFHSCWPANPMDSGTDPTPASYFILWCLHCCHSLHCAFCYTQLQTNKQTKKNLN